ncbi:Dolichyl-diphosphooligosaccharide--protein glycosyltransferase 48 kDa subunit [Rhynchospora pubera]|uniref:Dolichyl-diphosphooligosaccharide--protein glycosyltransferase 48 kDa subunit n=1 Tax=Rhynchospora pubera TaxID=906938 RepID=A0AAV8BR49_9POAL|nr:Dolichyl-diphosphooligosaccharide--protein glycosyltransferase 48 kDa subunit [Rhynchospora pubera]KAJ4801262.1 Dolichyl-diphosphooligosaccharide--protein glycosyltransferase 48 kDa subunit [Rhynchospora pubera]
MAKQRPSLLLLLSLISLLLSPPPAFSFSDESPTARRILVLVDDLALRSSHSIFFDSLVSRGYQLEFKLADDPSLSLQRYGQFLYDGLVLFAPSVSRFGGSLDQSKVLEFVDAGHDLILAVDSNASDLVRGIATDSGADFDEDPEAVVIDHLSYAVSDADGDHTLIASDNLIKSNVILGDKAIEAPILFRGIGHSVNPANTLVLKALTASPSAYSANPKTKLSSPPSLTGSSISLVSVMQARNNARVLISGSLELFSNRFLRSSVQKAGSKTIYDKSGNEQFVTEAAKWVFHERGHLKAVNVKHNKVGETTEPGIYRINDDLEYSVEIYEWSGKSWEPYVADDVQVQFFMMSPYVLKTMSTNKKGLYSTSFKVPDVYGVFQFKVEYERLGYTSLSLAKQIPVRPFRHNEYERFIPAAFPYYAASFSTMGAFFIFSIVYLYHK